MLAITNFGNYESAMAESRPRLGDHNRVPRIGGVVANRGGQSNTAGVQIDQMAKIGDVLRCLITDTGDVVAKDQQLQLAPLPGLQLTYIDDRAGGDSSHFADYHPPLPPHLFGTLSVFIH